MALKLINTDRHALTLIVHADRMTVDAYGGADFPYADAPALLRELADEFERARRRRARHDRLRQMVVESANVEELITRIRTADESEDQR